MRSHIQIFQKSPKDPRQRYEAVARRRSSGHLKKIFRKFGMI